MKKYVGVILREAFIKKKLGEEGGGQGCKFHNSKNTVYFNTKPLFETIK